MYFCVYVVPTYKENNQCTFLLYIYYHYMMIMIIDDTIMMIQLFMEKNKTSGHGSSRQNVWEKNVNFNVIIQGGHQGLRF